MTHIPDDVLSAWLEDELGKNQRARVEAHLEVCRRCRGELAALRGVIRRAREAPSEWVGKTASWSALETRLEGRRRPDPTADSKSLDHRSHEAGASARWGWSAGGLAAAAIIASLVYFPRSDPGTTAGLEVLLAADSQVAEEVEAFLVRKQWEAPEVRQAIADGNREIDEGMRALRKALEERPEDPILADLARRATSHRVDLLREVTR